jgi:putative oxidoreductase
MQLGTTLLRGTIGPLFIGHGGQKLFGWFGGHGIEGTGGFFESLGLRPGTRHAKAAGAAEMAGGALLTLGALTPLASTLIASSMVTAIRKATAKSGPWVTDGGWEYNAVLIAAVTEVAERGPGSPSVDAAFFPQLRGTAVAALSLAGAIAGSFLWTSPLFDGEDQGAQEGEAGAAGDTAPGEQPAPAPATAGQS